MDTSRTARLTATRLAHNDLPNLVALHLDPEISRFLGVSERRRLPPTIWRRIFVTGPTTGWVYGRYGRRPGPSRAARGLRYIEVEGVTELEIAYTLVKPLWGQGFATEIAKALVDHWASERADPSLVGIVMKGNVGSERVLLTAGLTYERDAIFHGEICSVFRRRR